MSDQLGLFDDDGPSLADAKAWLKARVDVGATCPCCTQFAKVYKRQITGSSAAALITMWRQGQGHPVHLPTLRGKSGSALRGGDPCKMAYWRLIVEETELREDGGRAGWWAVTDLGRAFVHDEVTIPRYAHIYDGRCLRLDGEPRTIRQALGTKFNYRELMDG